MDSIQEDDCKANCLHRIAFEQSRMKINPCHTFQNVICGKTKEKHLYFVSDDVLNKNQSH